MKTCERGKKTYSASLASRASLSPSGPRIACRRSRLRWTSTCSSGCVLNLSAAELSATQAGRSLDGQIDAGGVMWKSRRTFAKVSCLCASIYSICSHISRNTITSHFLSSSCSITVVDLLRKRKVVWPFLPVFQGGELRLFGFTAFKYQLTRHITRRKPEA